jgi:nicotinate (nicotinamide) nucleotide adenylyltransferase
MDNNSISRHEADGIGHGISTAMTSRPLTIGVFGGSFNPIHLGHALLAITVQQTTRVDHVVVVPVYKHAVKKDLLPFEDRVHMCRLAVAAFGSDVSVSTIEQEVGESNGAMLRALKATYPLGTQFLWICGDDFFRWMDRPKGLETVAEVSGLIVQRRLHRHSNEHNVFFKEPVDEARVRAVAIKMELDIEYIYGELPHFSSTLVRKAPGHWRSFLTRSVVEYLDERPHLLQQLIANLEADAQAEEEQRKQSAAGNEPSSVTQASSSEPRILKKSRIDHARSQSTIQAFGVAAGIVMRGLDAVHALQYERGHTGLCLSTGQQHMEQLQHMQEQTDSVLHKEVLAPLDVGDMQLLQNGNFDEVLSLAAELERIPVWLQMDRTVLKKRAPYLSAQTGPDGWLSRLALVEKFNPRIDVLIGATIRALTEILSSSNSPNERSSANGDIPELLFKWCQGKEALGRLRAFVCAGGPEVPCIVQTSLRLRERLVQTIDTKERLLARVLSLQAGFSSRLSAPDALHKLLENVTAMEYELMRCFATSTKLSLVHKILADREQLSRSSSEETGSDFDVHKFFSASSTALDFLLSFAKALTASACASAN